MSVRYILPAILTVAQCDSLRKAVNTGQVSQVQEALHWICDQEPAPPLEMSPIDVGDVSDLQIEMMAQAAYAQVAGLRLRDLPIHCQERWFRAMRLACEAVRLAGPSFKPQGYMCVSGGQRSYAATEAQARDFAKERAKDGGIHEAVAILGRYERRIEVVEVPHEAA